MVDELKVGDIPPGEVVHHFDAMIGTFPACWTWRGRAVMDPELRIVHLVPDDEAGDDAHMSANLSLVTCPACRRRIN